MLKCTYNGRTVPCPPQKPAELDQAAHGRAAWTALHRAALAGDITAAWLDGPFAEMIPRFGCACREEWARILARIPLRPQDQIAWSVEVHNAVNTQLGKPQFTLDEALAVWSVQPV